MQVAFVLPAPSALEEGMRPLLEALKRSVELTTFGPGAADQPLDSLAPKAVDRILYPVADDAACAAMPPLIRALGGVVWLHEWKLGTLARAFRPALARGGLAARLAAWREGGLSAARRIGGGEEGELPLNRSVVRFGDAFVVPSEELRQAILEDRNAPTPMGLLEPGGDPEQWATELAALLAAFPAHRANRKSLIATAIEGADRARAERRAEKDAGSRPG